MKRTVTITKSEEVEMDIPAFFKGGNIHYYMDRGEGRFTQVCLPNNEPEKDVSISNVGEWTALNLQPIVEITMDEFYSKLNEALNILSIGSHKVEEDELNRFSMDREQIEAHR